MSILKSSIAYRLFFAVCVFSAALTLITTSLLLFNDYHDKIDAIEEDVRHIVKSELLSLAANLWVMDKELLNNELTGILHFRHMEQVKILSGTKIIAEAGNIRSKKLIHREIPIVHSLDNRPANIGVLHINFGLDSVYAELRHDAWRVLFYQAVLIFFIALFILYIVRHLIIRHLSAMARHVAQLEGGKLDEALILKDHQGAPREEDELGHVASALNTMSRKLKGSFDALKLNEERLEALLSLSQMSMQAEEDLARHALATGVRLTGSGIGYLVFIHEDEKTIRLHLWSRDVNPLCTAENIRHYPLDQAGLWADSARLMRPVVHNDYQGLADKRGYPEGHPAVLRHLSVPVLDEGKVVAVAGVGNKEEPYDDLDIMQLNLFMNSMWTILKQRRTENALTRSEHSYRTLAENLPCVVYRLFLREDNRMHFFNRMGEKIIGYQDDELSSGARCPIESLIPGDQRQQVQSAIAQAIVTGKAFSIEYDIVHRDGNLRHLSEQGMPVMGADGLPLYIEGVIFDITQRKHVEETLQKSQEFIKNILDTVDDGFIVVDPEFKILAVNKAYCEQINQRAENVIGRFCYEVSHQLARPCHEMGHNCAARKTFQSGEPSTSIHEHVSLNNQVVYVDTKSFPLKDESGKVVSVIEVVNDVTEKRRLEEQLRHAQKMEAIGLLAGGVAHDFNNILSAIIGYGSLITMKLRPDDENSTYMEHILTAAGRAANLTQSLLAFSRKQLINPKPVNLNEIILNIEKLLRRIISEDIELSTALHPAPLTIMGDIGQIEQLVMNLTTNARDAMPNGGLLSIKTESAQIDEAFIRMHGFGTRGDYAVLTVTDSGTGMDEYTKKRVFEPFFTTKEQGRGTGLGLAMVYGAIKQNNGYITVDSEPGQGAAFRLFLPLLGIATAGETPAPAARAKGGTETVLIAEDDDMLRNLTSSILAKFGYSTILAKDGVDALIKFNENRETIKLLILDVIMPKMDGKAVYEEVRGIRPDMKALFISGYTAEILHNKGIGDDGIHFLSKPIEPELLALTVRKILDNKTDSD